MTKATEEARARLGVAIRDARLRAGLDHRKAATLAGIAASTWLRIEHGEHGGQARTLAAIAGVLGWPEGLPEEILHAPSEGDRLATLEARVAELERSIRLLVSELGAVAAPTLARRLSTPGATRPSKS